MTKLAQNDHGFTKEKGSLQDLEFWQKRLWDAVFGILPVLGDSWAGEFCVFRKRLSCRCSDGTQAHFVKADMQRNVSKSLFLRH